ncbi:MAG: heat-inducible transcription repressor HrcA [Chloroflexi bacterium]|nr:heat-inducible transcription repressor HrcA [Chloroflexota bacterium]
MERRLNSRKEEILRVVIDEFARSGTPIASADVLRHRSLGVSPATVRNEIAWLKDEGFLMQPHTSAGSVPSDRGYRYYVNSLLENKDLSLDEQRLIRHMFHQVENELEQWVGLAALLLAQLVQNAAMVVPPKAPKARLKRLQLIAVQSQVALLILILLNGRLRRQLITFDQPVIQDDLDKISNRLNAMYEGRTRGQIDMRSKPLPALADRVSKAVTGMMAAEDEQEYEQPYFEGLRNLLAQPEFVHSGRALELVDMLEKKALAKSVLAQKHGKDVNVVIGQENQEEALKDLSLIVTAYGIPDEFSGVIGVVGPRRMQYSRSISAVRFLAALLGQLSAEIYEGRADRGAETG